MSKIFTWIFGAITGLVTGIMLVGAVVAIDPDKMGQICDMFKEDN